MSLAVLLAQHNDVIVLDVDSTRIEKINAKQSTVIDSEIEAFLDKKRAKYKGFPRQTNCL